MARRRAGLSQRDLAERLGCRQATIARWERGDRQPSFADVQAAAAACSLQLDAHLTPPDRSCWPQIAAQLDLEPLERVRRLAGQSATASHLELLAQRATQAIVIGDVAGALHGWPLVLNSSRLELCVPAGSASPERDASRGPADTAPAVALVPLPPGTAGFSDLARGAESIPLAGGAIRVASLLDLLRIADASPDPAARRQALACQAVLDVQRARRAAPTMAPRSDQAKIEDWLGHRTPVAPA